MAAMNDVVAVKKNVIISNKAAYGESAFIKTNCLWTNEVSKIK